MMLVLTVLLVLSILCLNELLWRGRRAHGELNRKFVHMVVGSFVAFWPLWLTWNEIRLLSLAFLIVVVVSKRFKLFQAIHSVQRPTWGEAFFAIAVGLTTFITHSRGIYAAALLQMALADGIAAVLGVKYGKPYQYRILGHTKSVLGSGAFLLTSYAILLAYALYSTAFGIVASLGIAIAATLVENIAVLGIDNLAVPLLVALALRIFA